VEREHGIPVEASEKAAGSEGGCLVDFVFANFPLEPSFSRKAHFGVEKKVAFLFVSGYNAPEVERVAGT